MQENKCVAYVEVTTGGLQPVTIWRQQFLSTYANAMQKASLVAFSMFALSLGMFGQIETPIFKVEGKSAFVWGEDNLSGAVSSTVQDPLTGNAIYKLNYDGIEVSSRMGFEAVGNGEAGAFLNYTTTIVNGTDAELFVRYGGISVDGHSALPLWAVPSNQSRRKSKSKRKTDVVELSTMHCFTGGFLSSENFFSPNASSQVFAIAPGRSLTVSSVVRDPRHYSLRCSVEGCFPTGAVRYYLKVNSRDYVFVWPGRSAIYCGQ